MQLVGQKHIMEQIDRWKEFPNFLIVQGPRHYGKTYFVIYLCEKFGLHYVKVNNSVGDIRELISLMRENSNTVYHFKDFDSASLQAKNALLKVTEETKRGNHIVITGNTQIKTLESRAKKFVMSAYSVDDIITYMNKYFEGLDDKAKKELYDVGINTPAKVVYYHKCENIYTIKQLADTIFLKLTYISILDSIDIYTKFESKYTNTIDEAELFLMILINIVEKSILQKQAYHYFEILKILVTTKEKLERDKTLNRKLMLYRAFYQLVLLRGKCNEKIRGFKERTIGQ